MADYLSPNRKWIQGVELREERKQSSSDSHGPSTFVKDVGETFDELEQLLIRKHIDYGPTNISLSPGGPINGLRVRIHDKTARINNLIDKGIEQPQYESLEDSFKDLANYAIIALLVLRDKWDK